MPADLTTAAGYRAFLVANGNPPSMVEELLRSRAFPAVVALAGAPAPRKPAHRPDPGEQLAFDAA